MRVLTIVWAAVLVSAVAVVAQNTDSKPDGKQVILSGCLGGGPSKFVLTNVAMAAPAGNKGENPVGTPALAGSYDLTPRDGLALAPHVGHRVELTGVITAMPKPGEGGPSDKAEPGAKVPAAQFAVSSLKMISPLCLQ